MLGIAQINARIHSLEQTIARSSLPLSSITLPALTTTSATSQSQSSSHATIVAKLNELSAAFKQLCTQEPLLQQYFAVLPSVQSLVATSPSTLASAVAVSNSSSPSSSTNPSSTSSADSILKREEEVILSASSMLEKTSELLRQVQEQSLILDSKWPVDNIGTLEGRVAKLESDLSARAFAAAQLYVHMDRFLTQYGELIDMTNRQWLLWNQQLEHLEKQVDVALEKKLKK